MSANISALTKAATFGLVLLLGACGGGGSKNRSSNQAPNDSFVSQVLSIIGTTSETAEPVDIKSIELTRPENTQPVSLR